MKKLVVAGLCMMIWSGEAMAVCQTASITATTPTADFLDHGNGTVTHTRTGLMWKQCAEGLTGAGCATGAPTVHTWQQALQLAKALNLAGGFAGFTDWRVPNMNELKSIVERQCTAPAINAMIFPATPNNFFVSASPVSAVTSAVSLVGFNTGGDAASLKSGSFYVRLVRGGQ